MRWMVALIWRLPPRSRRWRLVLPELTGIGATPAARASLASVAKRCGAGDLADELGGGQRPEAGLGEQVRRDLGDEVGDLGFERLDRLRELADAAQLVAGDADAHRLLGAREPPGDARAPVAVKQRAARQLQFGPEVVQMPLQRVVERDALADQPLAVIDEQPQVELGPVQAAPPAARPGLRAAPLARPRARRCCRTCRARELPRRDAGHQLASRRAPPARRARSGTAPTSPRRAGSPPAPTPARRPGRAPIPQRRRSPSRRPGPSARRATRRCSPTTAAIVCERLCMSAPSTIIDLVHLHLD